MSASKVVLVCGSRTWTDRVTIRAWLTRLPACSVIVHGAAPGADTIAGEEAAALGFTVRSYPARWETEGNAAGPLRNQRMLDSERVTLVLAFTHALVKPARTPTGTGDMVVRAVGAGIRATIVPPGVMP